VLPLVNIADHPPFLINCIQHFLICDFLSLADLQLFRLDPRFKRFYFFPLILCHFVSLLHAVRTLHTVVFTILFLSSMSILLVDRFFSHESVRSHGNYALIAIMLLIAVSIFGDNTFQVLELFYLFNFVCIN